jgi:hypothetical protein
MVSIWTGLQHIIYCARAWEAFCTEPPAAMGKDITTIDNITFL